VWPPDQAGPALPHLSLTVGRGFGTVTVTVDGELSVGGSELLEGVLTDLIEGQGNRTVVVNLEQAVVDPAALRVFLAAGHSARVREALLFHQSSQVAASALSATMPSRVSRSGPPVIDGSLAAKRRMALRVSSKPFGFQPPNRCMLP